MDKRMLPIGIEDFAELRREGCYYIDKTEMIPELLEKKYKVNLITRPRRFGKTLLMSMLAEFFDITKDSSDIFEGLNVLRREDICASWMNRWPVLFLTFKNVEGLNFEGAYGLLKKLLSAVCKDHAYLADSSYVAADDRKSFLKLKAEEEDEAEVKSFLDTLMRMMTAHFGKPVILLLDEYDVPLAKASENGYYVQMLDIIRSMLGIALKSNRFLKFAVITGCLRIAKESIFTGTNNFVSCSIADYRFQEYFGFTEEEVIRMLGDYSLSGCARQLKAWYDGYCFGNQELYCPWDVLNYMGDLQSSPAAKPGNYWKNTSHNNIIRGFVGRMDLSVNEKFEILLEGRSIREKICEDLTYDVLHSSESNFWSILYLTGYLTRDQKRASDGDEVWLKIPNEEIRSIFRETVLEWFQESMEVLDRRGLFAALWSGISGGIQL